MDVWKRQPASALLLWMRTSRAPCPQLQAEPAQSPWTTELQRKRTPTRGSRTRRRSCHQPHHTPKNQQIKTATTLSSYRGQSEEEAVFAWWTQDQKSAWCLTQTWKVRNCTPVVEYYWRLTGLR